MLSSFLLFHLYNRYCLPLCLNIIAYMSPRLSASTRGEWSGDVDLNDGVLNCLYQECKDRLKLAAEIGLRERGIQQSLNHDLKKSMEQLSDDLKFIHKGKHCVLLSLATLLLYNLHTLELQKVSSTYAEKQRSKTIQEKEFFSLAWDIQELQRLNDKGRSLRTELSSTLDIVGYPQAMQQQCNLSRKLGSIRTNSTEFIKGIFKFKRVPATHIFVFMISSALRNLKPYALPIQCVPYKGLKEGDMRRMINTIVQEMVSMGMKVAGMLLILMQCFCKR